MKMLQGLLCVMPACAGSGAGETRHLSVLVNRVKCRRRQAMSMLRWRRFLQQLLQLPCRVRLMPRVRRACGVRMVLVMDKWFLSLPALAGGQIIWGNCMACCSISSFTVSSPNRLFVR